MKTPDELVNEAVGLLETKFGKNYSIAFLAGDEVIIPEQEAHVFMSNISEETMHSLIFDRYIAGKDSIDGIIITQGTCIPFVSNTNNELFESLWKCDKYFLCIVTNSRREFVIAKNKRRHSFGI